MVGMAEQSLGTERDVGRDPGVAATGRQDYERADTRWQHASTTRDWIILLVVIALQTSWMLVVFFLEPGIR